MVAHEPQHFKRELRQSLLAQRQSLTVAEWQQYSHRLCKHLQAHLIQIQAQTVLAYISTRQEPDLSPLFDLPKLTWGLPRCQGQTLQCHRWAPPQPLVLGKYGIQEPQAAWPQISPEAVDLILVPAVACDHQGYRLGYGGGYYDRLLGQPEWHHIPTIGIVFEFAYLPTLPHEAWDVPLTVVCTEQGIKNIKNN